MPSYVTARLQLIVSLILVLIATISTSTSLVVLGHDRGTDTLDLLVLLLHLLGISLWVRLDPLLTLLDSLHDLLLLLLLELLAQALVVTATLSGHLHTVQVVVEGVLGVDT